MRFNPRIRAALCGAALVTAAAVMAAKPALADGYRDRISADSFGNLAISSPGGYKRIVVGQGHLAAELAAYSGGSEDEVVYLDQAVDGAYARGCTTQGVLLHGRSYMYGLPDNVVPVLAHPCR